MPVQPLCSPCRQQPINQMVFLILLVSSIRDIRDRRICLAPTLAAAAAGLVLRTISAGAGQSLAAAGPGLFLLAISLLSRGRVGFGDGLVLLAAGLWSGPYPAWLSLLLGLLLAFLLSLLKTTKRIQESRNAGTQNESGTAGADRASDADSRTNEDRLAGECRTVHEGRTADPDRSIPFVPFLLAGYLLQSLLG